ncbi:resolvase, partial [bacterium CG_4_9_14_3_um_filter_65_15]
NCVPCGCAMVPTHTTKQDRRYRYYVCAKAQKRGWHACPSKSIPAGEIEKFVVDQVRGIGRDPAMIDEDEAIHALAAFDPVWETLTLREQARVLQLLIQRVDYDGDKGTVSVTFHPAGIETLSREYAKENA